MEYSWGSFPGFRIFVISFFICLVARVVLRKGICVAYEILVFSIVAVALCKRRRLGGAECAVVPVVVVR